MIRYAKILNQYSQRKPCYYCGAEPPSSGEHAPPKMMTAGFGCSRITVPSCAQHNTEKCGTDQAIVSALIQMVRQGRLLLLRQGGLIVPLPAKVLEAIRIAEPKHSRARNHVSLRPFL